jgi:hypothetical protein
MRIVLVLAALAAGCGSSPCAKVCQKLQTCNALSVSVAQCTQDCEQPANGHSCANEDAIASCMESASCDDLTKESSRLKCPACQ